MTIIYIIIIIISFRYIFEKLIIIIKNDVNDLNLNKFRETFIIKIKVAFIIISDFIKFDVVDSKITIGELYNVIFIKNEFSKKRRSCVINVSKL